MATLALAGCGSGIAIGLYNLIIVEIMGRENLASVYGVAGLLVAVGYLAAGPVIGKTLSKVMKSDNV